MKPTFLLLWTLAFGAPALAQPTTTGQPTHVAILLYPGVELLDFAGPLEVFSLMENSRVYTVAAKPGPFKTMKQSLTLTPDYTLTDCPPPDILVVPGAAGEHLQAVVADTAVIGWVQRTSAGCGLTMSVCTGAYILGKAGLLANKTVTTHWASTQMLQQMIPKARVMERTRFVEDGKLLTTAGVSAGLDGALRVVARLRGLAAARSVAEVIEYDHFNPNTGLIVGQQAMAPAKLTRSAPKRTRSTPTPGAKPVRLTPVSAPLGADGIDPVCQMTVRKGTQLTVMFGAKQYGFCSSICKIRFERNPAQYIAK